MSILEEIQQWSTSLPSWQQDAIARLYANPQLTPEDFEDIYALLKAEHGIPDENQRVPAKLRAEEIASSSSGLKLVQLAAIKNLENVNAIAKGVRLPISPNALTIIYGGNGSGKSGYARVLKKACRARDQRERILPNANEEPSSTGPASASFELLVGGEAIDDIEWEDGQDSPDILSALSVFDSHCARAYVDNQGDFAYSPYGLDILQGLVRVCGLLKERVNGELQATKPNLEPFAALAATETRVGSLISSLSAKTKIDDIQQLAVFTKENAERFETLEKTLAETDPKKKAQAIRLQAARFKELLGKIKSTKNAVSDEKLSNLAALIEKSKVAEKAAISAGKEFQDSEGLLPGTGSDEWKVLFEAARSFTQKSHPGKEFPDFAPDDSCPLCQNKLGETALSRLKTFDDFIQQEVEKVAKEARRAAENAYHSLTNQNLDIGVNKALRDELNEWKDGLGDACHQLQSALNARLNSIKPASAGDIPWSEIPSANFDFNDELEEAQAKLIEEAKALEESADEKVRKAMSKEFAELKAAKLLSEMKGLVLETVYKLGLCEKLGVCLKSCGRTTGISRKSTDLARTMATPEVAAALNEELDALNVRDLQVAMQNESPGGKTKFKLVLQVPGGGKPMEILSEGEQRAIAIASFLAEVNLGANPGGIIFDDPVSSLDHKRRWKVAERLAKEAKKRQVIVFTHDIYFLCILQQEAEKLNYTPLAQFIRRTPEGFGSPSERLPFEALSTKKRVARLRSMQVDAAKAAKAGDEDEARKITHEAYFQLRSAWERAVEEVLFQGVVNRFEEGVSTQLLKGVVVEDDDYKIIDENMAKSSKFAHDPASTAMISTPNPEELGNDIVALENWRKSVEARKETVRASRQ